MLEEKLTFKGHANLNLVGILKYPEEKRPCPCAILCHGLRDTKDLPILVDLGRALNKINMGTFRMDFSGSGESEGNFEDKKISDMAIDLQCAVHAVVEHGKVSKDRIALIGRSFSSLIVMIVGAKLKAIKAMVLMATPFDPSDGRMPINRLPKKNGFIDLSTFHPKNIKEDFLNDLKSLGFEALAKKLSNVLIIHADSDQIVNVEHSIKLFDKIRAKKVLRIIEGANHKFEGKEKEVTNIIISWFQENEALS